MKRNGNRAELLFDDFSTSPGWSPFRVLWPAGAIDLHSHHQQPSLRHGREIQSRTVANHSVRRRVFSNVDLEIQGRSASFEVVEVPDELPNVVGQTPLVILDWVVDTRSRRLIPNPEHKGGELCGVLMDDRPSAPIIPTHPTSSFQWVTGMPIRLSDPEKAPRWPTRTRLRNQITLRLPAVQPASIRRLRTLRFLGGSGHQAGPAHPPFRPAATLVLRPIPTPEHVISIHLTC